MIDLDIFKSRAEVLGIAFNEEDCNIVDLKKGWYKGTSLYPYTGMTSNKYSTLEFVK